MIAFNRTIIELKLFSRMATKPHLLSFNRTIIELKPMLDELKEGSILLF